MSDPGQAFIALGCLAAVIGGVSWFVRHVGDRGDQRARDAKVREYDERREREAATAAVRDLDRYFPFLGAPFRSGVADGMVPEEAFWTAIDNTEAVRLGTTLGGLPALLPLEERRKHLYVVGTTGSGKTTLVLHILKEDLEAGRGVCVIGPERDLFRDWLLPMVPEERAEEVVYFAPGHPENPVAFNPLTLEEGEDRAQAAEELLESFRRAVGEDEFGVRMAPILANVFVCLMSRPRATLFDVKRVLEDPAFRQGVASSCDDEYARSYLLNTYPTLPKGSHTPIINRLDSFLRPQPLRRALCQPRSTFSIRRILAEGGILFVDLSGLTDVSKAVVGHMLLARFQLELMRREAIAEELRSPFYVFAEEFAAYAKDAETTWRALLSRGRRFGLALTLSHQFPAQLPEAVRREVLGVTNSMVVFSQGAQDAELLRRNMLEATPGGARPLPAEAFVTLQRGQAIARLGTGAFAIPLKTPPPLTRPLAWRGERTQAASWERYGVPSVVVPRAEPRASGIGMISGSESFLE